MSITASPGVATGDMVRVNVRGRLFVAEVTDRRGDRLSLAPVDRAVPVRSCTMDCVLTHWALVERHAPGVGRTQMALGPVLET